ncbi:PLP-dependent transferase [Penicillium angulare]|uniref:PLP-dependent transferase n=1 Tax=Penicillium angulare TaxID=116970 RepID=A0A9W9KIS5_9EURO|nr:PLP-dependent transferase [Penicillium angulare]
MSSNAGETDPARTLESTIIEHGISKRGAINFIDRDVWGPREKSMGNPWAPNNPGGTYVPSFLYKHFANTIDGLFPARVILRLAENSLMHEEVSRYLLEQMNVLPVEHLSYSTGPRGSRRLRRAAATLLNEAFQSRTPVTYDNILVTPGLASAIDGITFSICDDGDGILIPQPLYNGFQFDMLNRSNVQVTGVKYEGVEGFKGLDDLFKPDINSRALENALTGARKAGINVRALLISNPHNPLGRCYPPETLLEFAAFCGRNNLHLISDEIYALSVFSNPEAPSLNKFTSILSLDLDPIIGPERKHVLYGASKDFCANGLRMGFIYTKNEGILGAMSSIGMFSWSPHILQDAWAAMIENGEWMKTFMKKKTQLMLDRYKTTTAFLSEHGIAYVDMNAGFFIWIDLRQFLVSQPQEQQVGTDIGHKTLPSSQPTLESELKFADICMENGVMVAPGHVYMSEEYGWFRITFTVGQEALEEGLKRILISLKKMQTGDSH